MEKFKILLAVVMSTAIVFGADAQARAKRKANENTAAWRYEIEYAKTGAGNMLVVKVWSYAKKPAVAIEQCKKNAVHGVIFKGYTSSETGTISQKPLAKEPDVMTRHQPFFEEFFADGGPYMKYVSATADGNTSVVKAGKEYKAGVVVTVNKDQLRTDLEQAGIIKSLTSGF